MKPLGASKFAQQSKAFANVVFLTPHLQKLKRAKTARTYQGFCPSAPQMNPPCLPRGGRLARKTGNRKGHARQETKRPLKIGNEKTTQDRKPKGRARQETEGPRTTGNKNVTQYKKFAGPSAHRRVRSSAVFFATYNYPKGVFIPPLIPRREALAGQSLPG